MAKILHFVAKPKFHRKVQYSGGQHYVNVPSEIAEEMDLNKGSSVFVLGKKDCIHVVTPEDVTQALIHLGFSTEEVESFIHQNSEK